MNHRRHLNIQPLFWITLFIIPLFATAGEITVTVRDAATLEPIPRTAIQVYQGTSRAAQENTDADGRVTFTLDPGQYDLATFRADGHVDEWHNGALRLSGARVDEVDPIDVTTTSSDSVFFDLGPESLIEGRLTASDGNLNMSGYSIIGAGLPYSGFTRPDGTFTIENAPAGTYYLFTRRTNVSYLHEWYGGTLVSPIDLETIPESALPVTVAESATVSGIDFELDPGNVVEIILKAGTSNVTDFAVETRLILADGPVSSPQFRQRPDPVTGVFRFEGLFPGTYEVGVNTFDFYGWLDANTTIDVPSGGGVTTLEIPLEQASILSGRVVDGDGNPLSGFTVSARGTGNGGTFTDEDGNYQIDVLPGPEYHVRAGRVGEVYQTEWYDDIPGSPTSFVVPEGSTPIAAPAGERVTGIDFVLEPATILEGTVTSEQGIPLRGIDVSIYRADGRRVASTTTGNQGDYTVTYLATGTYYLQAEGGDDFLSEWSADAAVTPTTLPDRPDPVADGAQAIVMPPGETTTVDFSLTPQARLIGRVSDRNDASVAGATLSLHNAAGSVVATTSSAADGTYAFEGLEVGSFFLRAERGSASTWFGQVIGDSTDPTADGATAIELSRGETIANIWLRDTAVASELGTLRFGSFGLGIEWSATLGERYQVQWSEAVDGTWQAAPNGDAPEMKNLRIADASGVLLYTCPLVDPERYFRVVTLP